MILFSIIMRLFVKAFLKKQQALDLSDLKKAIQRYNRFDKSKFDGDNKLYGWKNNDKIFTDLY